MSVPIYLQDECIDRTQTIAGDPANCIGCRRKARKGERSICSVYRDWQVGCKTRAIDNADQAQTRIVPEWSPKRR